MNINHTQVGKSDGSAYWLAQLCTSPRNEALVQSIEKWYQMVMGSVYLQYTFSIPSLYLQYTFSIPSVYLQYTFSILKISLEKKAAMYSSSVFHIHIVQLSVYGQAGDEAGNKVI